MSELVLRRVCKVAGISSEAVKGKDCSRPTSFKRNYVIYALRERGYSMIKIGGLVGRDHSTVVHALKRFPETCYTWHHPVSIHQINDTKRDVLRMAAE